MFEAQAEGMDFLSSVGIVRIPFFQRRYVWDQKNWDELYENFFDSDIPGFLGSIILKLKQRKSVTETNECSVIDGQQRLTTLSILIVALYDSLNDAQKKIYKDRLVNILYLPKRELDENNEVVYEPRMIHSHLDSKEFKEVMDLKNTQKIKESDSLITNCYKHFYEKFCKEDYEKRVNLLELLIVNPIQILVVISIDKEADEQKVFDTLNSAGVRLTMADTIKNYLFNRVSNIIDGDNASTFSDEVINLYETTWKEHFCENDDLDKKWLEEFVTGRIKRTNIDMFLHCYATIKGIYSPIQTLADLPSVFKSYINTFNTKNEIENFLVELCDYADLYLENFINVNKETKYSYDETKVLPRLLLFSETIGTKTFNPYILYLLKKYKENSTKLNEELHKIEKILIFTFLTKNTSRSKNYNKLCVDFIKKEDRIDEEIQSLGDLNSGITGLYRMYNNEAKVLLFLIELYRRKDKKNDIVELEYKETYQLEHIMPQKWQTHWNTLPEKDDSGNILDRIEDKVDYRESKIKCLGNMTILKDKLNSSISNSAFKIKVNGDGINKGIREYADFKITKDDVVAYFDNGGEWNEARINKRTKDLYNEIVAGYLY